MNWSAQRPVFMAAIAAVAISGCSQVVPPHLKPIPAEAKALLAQKDMREDAPIMVRIFKEESELEVWKAKDDGRFHHFKTYPICNYSGKLGPKLKQGDKQSPEGFYKVSAKQMNPNSSYHLSFNLGYPNAFDKSHKRTGDYLMVHGDCKSAGCYAMTDALIEEIYALAREAFTGGQEAFDVHAMPFRMTLENMRRHSRNRNYAFWRNDLYQGYKDFEDTRLPPKIDVCERHYLVNVSFSNGQEPQSADAKCPAFQRLPLEALPKAPTYREASNSSSKARPMSIGQPRAIASTGNAKPMSIGQPATTAASQATIGHGSTFGFAPKIPSKSGFAFRLNSTLGK